MNRFIHLDFINPPSCPACPLIPAGENFSWINYVPQIRTFEKSYNGRAGSLYPAWEVFNASGASASWANPVLPTNEESIVCRRRIRRGHRLLIALWHPDRASPATNGSVGGLRTLLDLSNQQLRVVSQIIQQAYNDAVFGCMTAAQKSTWLNHLTARLPAEWDTLDAFDVTSEDIVDRADPTDMGLDLTTREYVHVTQCMEREGVPWEVALHKLRQQRRTLWFRCKMVVEQVVSVLSGRAGRHQDEFRHPGGPALERTLRRQRALESLMERTGALNGCLDTGEKQTRPWWERKDFDPSMDQQQQRGTTLWISDTTCPSRRLSSTHPINPPPVWSFTIIILIHPSIYGHTAATILSIHPSIHIHTPRQNERQYIQMGGMTTIKTTSKRRPCQALIADGSRLCAYAARPDSDTCTVHIFASGREKKERKTATAAKSQKSSNQGDGRGKFFELAPAVTRMARRQPMRSEPDDDNNNDDERGLRRRCLGGGPAAGGRRADPRHDKGIEGFGEDGAVRPGHSQISQSSPRSDVGYECTFAASIHPSPSSPLVVNPKNPNGRPPNLYVLPQVSSSVVHHHHRTSSRPTASISASASASSSSGALVVSVVRASTAGASPPSKSSVCATAAGASPSSKPSVSTTTILSATPSSSSSSFSSSSSDKSRGGEKSCRLGYHSTDCYLTLGVTMLADTRRRRVPLLYVRTWQPVSMPATKMVAFKRQPLRKRTCTPSVDDGGGCSGDCGGDCGGDCDGDCGGDCGGDCDGDCGGCGAVEGPSLYRVEFIASESCAVVLRGHDARRGGSRGEEGEDGGKGSLEESAMVKGSQGETADKETKMKGANKERLRRRLQHEQLQSLWPCSALSPNLADFALDGQASEVEERE
ncbi:hypothetical protein BC567DRAFT_213015 [Phyllosticta citribraziliensis]